MLLDTQARKLRKMLAKQKTLKAAAAAAGTTEKTARKYREGPMPSARKKPHTWRTRQSPFDAVWASEIVPALQADLHAKLRATTLLEQLQEQHPGEFSPSMLRSLQRKIAEWRRQHGPEKEVFFEQEHRPGAQAALDYTDCKELQVTIAGVPFEHKWFEFVLVFSGWRVVTLALSETFVSLQHGIQNAVFAMGGVAPVWRRDNLSAASRAISAGKRGLTERYDALLAHYGASDSPIQAGKGNENGSVERAHGTLKSALEQALILRGSRDFRSVRDYELWVQAMVDKLNAKRAKKFEQERTTLLPLPPKRLDFCEQRQSLVSRGSTIVVGKNTYSVPSRLIGCRVEVKLRAESMEVAYGGVKQLEISLWDSASKDRIHYRHVIESLVKKPGAFANYRFRQELFPTLTFRRLYDRLQKERPERADKVYLRILWFAARTMESEVEAAVEKLLDSANRLDFKALKAIWSDKLPAPLVGQNGYLQELDMGAYDALLRAS